MERSRDGARRGWSTSTGSGKSYAAFDDRRIRARALDAVESARKAVPVYARGRGLRTSEINVLLRACSMRVVRAEQGIPADTWPPIDGVVNLFVDTSVGPQLLRYIKLHEIGHRLAGDLEEPTLFLFDGPLPESEEVADLFAALGILDRAEIDQGPEFVEERLRQLVPLENYGWQTYRIPRLAGRVCEAVRWLEE